VSYENIICKAALPIAIKYLLALITFIIDKVEVFQTSTVVYVVCTRHKHNLHRPVANLWSQLCWKKTIHLLPVQNVYTMSAVYNYVARIPVDIPHALLMNFYCW